MSIFDRPPLPPHHLYTDFFEEAEVAGLIDWALANQLRFSPAPLADGSVDHARRNALRLSDLGPNRSWFERKVMARSTELIAQIGATPFETQYLELEIVAYGDGAHFHAHTDIPVGVGRKPLGGDSSGRQDRLLSAVYYFHSSPKNFTGGQLRLFRIGADESADNHVDVEPEQNLMVVFPSWAKHQVLRVSCPSGRFEDSRFAVNCWFCRVAFQESVMVGSGQTR